jgi:putative thioredoxin
VSESKTAWIFDVDEADFERAVIERSRERPVVVDFWASWCGPCRMLGPVLEKLVEERAGEILLAKVNIDNAQNLALAYGIEAIPAVKAFRDGRPVLEFLGVLPEAQLREFLDRVSPTEADRLAQQAAAVEATNATEAERLYRSALERDRDHGVALLGLARLLIARGQDAEANDLLGRIHGGEHAAEAERLQAILALRERARAFGDEAAARRRIAAEPENAQARYELGCILAAKGAYDEALAMLLSAAERDRKLAAAQVRETMVQVFHIIGVRSQLADEYRDKLARLLY